MPTRRMIHVELWQSENIAKLTRDQRLLFIGLFSNADDQGRLRGHPKVVSGLVFPYDDDIGPGQIDADLQVLADGDFIIRYGSGTGSLIQIKNWWVYQQPQWAYPSPYPSPDGWQDCIRGRKNNEVYTENWPPSVWNRKCDDPNDDSGEALPKDLPNDLPDSDGQSDSIGKNRDSFSGRNRVDVSDGSAVADDEGPPPAEPEQLNDPPEKAPEMAPPPQNLSDWLDVLQTVKNKQALIRRFIELHYPEHDVPAYSFIASTAKKLGRGINGYNRLLTLLYQAECHEPKGDLLPYVLAIAKKDSANAAYYRDGHDQHVKAEGQRTERPPLPVPRAPSPFYQEWQAALDELRSAFGEQSVGRWLRSSVLLERENGHAKIELADEACMEWVSNRWGEQIANILSTAKGGRPEVEYVIAKGNIGPSWLEPAEQAREAA